MVGVQSSSSTGMGGPPGGKPVRGSPEGQPGGGGGQPSVGGRSGEIGSPGGGGGPPGSLGSGGRAGGMDPGYSPSDIDGAIHSIARVPEFIWLMRVFRFIGLSSIIA